MDEEQVPVAIAEPPLLEAEADFLSATLKGNFNHPIAALFEVLRLTFGHMAPSSFTLLLAEAKEECVRLLLATTPHEVEGKARGYYFAEKLNGSDHAPEVDDRVECTREEANLVGSLCQDGLHRPVIDLDYGAQLVPSSTAGHYHLYLNTGMTEEKYLGLLQALSDAGVLSSFFVKAAQIRGQSFVRPPWVKKPPQDVENPQEEKL